MNSLRGSPAEKARAILELRRRADAEIESTAPPIWTPFPGSPQEMAYRSLADVAGYGGAAGGGKTDLEIGLALEGRKSIIFRREVAQLRDVVMRTQEILATAPDPGRLNRTLLMWQFRDGSTLELGGVKDPDDWQKYKGRPHDFIAFDEVTEFLENQVRSLMGWLRSADPTVRRCRAVMGFNPPTSSEGMWIIPYFGPWLDEAHPNPAAPGELRYFAMVRGEEVERPDGEPFECDGQVVTPQSRTFFPAKLDDNPALRDTGYRGTLQSLPEPLRSQLLNGDFKAGVRDDAWQIIPTAWIKAAQARWTADGGDSPQTMVGLDVAHGGADKTVAAPRHGNWIGKLKKVAGIDTPDGATGALVAVGVHKDNARINVDGIGCGASAAERLKDPVPEGHGLPAFAINVSLPSSYRDKSRKFRMVNQRAEMYWRLRDAVDPEGDILLALPPDPELLSDLVAMRYEITPSGIKVEPKDDIAKRLKRSPDCAEAVGLSMLQPKAWS